MFCLSHTYKGFDCRQHAQKIFDCGYLHRRVLSLAIYVFTRTLIEFVSRESMNKPVSRESGLRL